MKIKMPQCPLVQVPCTWEVGRDILLYKIFSHPNIKTSEHLDICSMLTASRLAEHVKSSDIIEGPALLLFTNKIQNPRKTVNASHTTSDMGQHHDS